MRINMRSASSRAVASVFVLATVLSSSACSDSPQDARQESATAEGSGEAEGSAATPPPGQSGTDDTELAKPPTEPTDVGMKEKLEQAKAAKAREKADPNSRTVCLNPDGTLAGEIAHRRRPDAPPIPDKQKIDGCKAAFGAKWKLDQ